MLLQKGEEEKANDILISCTYLLNVVLFEEKYQNNSANIL